jgi:hypothetical protein
MNENVENGWQHIAVKIIFGTVAWKQLVSGLGLGG